MLRFVFLIGGKRWILRQNGAFDAVLHDHLQIAAGRRDRHTQLAPGIQLPAGTNRIVDQIGKDEADVISHLIGYDRRDAAGARNVGSPAELCIDDRIHRGT